MMRIFMGIKQTQGSILGYWKSSSTESHHSEQQAQPAMIDDLLVILIVTIQCTGLIISPFLHYFFKKNGKI